MALPFLVLALFLIPASTLATDFTNVTYHRCYDGDTCTFTLLGVHPLFGEKISVRIAGIDTPEIRGKCEQEKTLAKEARDVVRGILEKAQHINLLDAERGKYFRIVARVMADGRNIGQTLIDQGWPWRMMGERKPRTGAKCRPLRTPRLLAPHGRDVVR